MDYRIDGSGSVGILTDTGYVTDEAAQVLPGVSLLVLESNHDEESLRSGPYPYTLKQRILGRQGHQSTAAPAASLSPPSPGTTTPPSGRTTPRAVRWTPAAHRWSCWWLPGTS